MATESTKAAPIRRRTTLSKLLLLLLLLPAGRGPDAPTPLPAPLPGGVPAGGALPAHATDPAGLAGPSFDLALELADLVAAVEGPRERGTLRVLEVLHGRANGSLLVLVPAPGASPGSPTLSSGPWIGFFRRLGSGEVQALRMPGLIQSWPSSEPARSTWRRFLRILVAPEEQEEVGGLDLLEPGVPVPAVRRGYARFLRRRPDLCRRIPEARKQRLRALLAAPSIADLRGDLAAVLHAAGTEGLGETLLRLLPETDPETAGLLGRLLAAELGPAAFPSLEAALGSPGDPSSIPVLFAMASCAASQHEAWNSFLTRRPDFHPFLEAYSLQPPLSTFANRRDPLEERSPASPLKHGR